MDRKKIKEQEIQLLAKEYKKAPSLFNRKTYVDDKIFLETIGIKLQSHIQENLFPGYIKLWPQDFIVEEVLKDGSVQTIDQGNFLKEGATSPATSTVYATLVKCGLSTIEVVDELTGLLGIDKKQIQFAGIKDKDALTSQLISFRGITKEALQNISSPYFFFKDVHYGKGAMEVGGLLGNKFTIFIRTHETFNSDQFLKNISSIKEGGFLNFYYSQRFGSPRFINWFWGLCILKGEYQKAVLSYLCSQGQREIEYFADIRREIKKNFGNWEKLLVLLEKFPLVFQNEIRLITYLKDHPQDFSGALACIPEQTQLWVYAYGSLLFNQLLSDWITKEKELPDYLPLILSKDKNDWKLYEYFLKKDNLFQIPIQHLKPFDFIQWKKRQIATRERVQIHECKVIEGGVLLSFTLPKGCYATTFLAHLFELVSGLPPQDINDAQIDAKALLGQPSIAAVIEKFKEVIHSKRENTFEKFE